MAIGCNLNNHIKVSYEVVMSCTPTICTETIMKLAQVVQEVKKLKVGRLPLIEEKLLPCLLWVIPSHAQYFTKLKVNLLVYF